MKFRGALLGGLVAAGVGLSGAGVSAALLDVPQDAVPASQDPVGDALRAAQASQAAPEAQSVQPNNPQVQELPAGTTGITVVDPEPLPLVELPALEPVEDETEEVAEAEPEVIEPTVRRRHRVALIHAIDKTTAESMQFEVEVGGRPVRFAKSLIFKVRACEVTGPNELTEDAIAYVEAGIQPRAERASTEARQIFKGWMFASSPSLNGIEHPVYDAWVVGCKSS